MNVFITATVKTLVLVCVVGLIFLIKKCGKPLLRKFPFLGQTPSPVVCDIVLVASILLFVVFILSN